MLKNILFISILFLSCTSHAQTPNFNEIFRQKRTARRYMARQIAELQLYIELTKKGYELVSDGLNIVQHITNGEFNLHQLFYASLKIVSPQIKKNSYLQTIVDQQLFIGKLVSELRKEINKDNQLTPVQRRYILSALNNLKTDTDQLNAQLKIILTDSRLELSDDQRINEINKLLTKSTSQLAFIRQFTSETLSTIQALKTEEAEINFHKSLHDIK